MHPRVPRSLAVEQTLAALDRHQAAASTTSGGIDEWKVVFDRFFVREADSGRGREGKQGHNEDVSGKFEESEIDSMREQKLRELEE